MAAQVELEPGLVSSRLHSSPLTDSSNKTLMEDLSIISSDPKKPAPGPKPRLTPKPYSPQRNATIRPILAPKPQPKPKPESLSKPELAGKPKPTSPSYQSVTTPTFGLGSKAEVPTLIPIPEPSSPLNDASKLTPTETGSVVRRTSFASRAKPSEWVSRAKTGGAITRTKSMGFLAGVGLEEDVGGKEGGEVVLRPQETRSSRPRPVSAYFLPDTTDAPISTPPRRDRRPLSSDLTTKFEPSTQKQPTTGESKENTPETPTPENGVWRRENEQTDPERGFRKKDVEGQEAKRLERTGSGIKRRISLLLDSSASTASPPATRGAEPRSPIPPIADTDGVVGVKQRIKELTEDFSASSSSPQKPQMNPRPLTTDRTKRFASDAENSSASDLKSVHEGVDELDQKSPDLLLSGQSKPQKDQDLAVDVTGGVQTVRASLFETVVEKHSVHMIEYSDSSMMKPTPKHSLSLRTKEGGLFSSMDDGDDISLVKATYQNLVSPTSPKRIDHVFDMVAAVEEKRVVSENIPAAHLEEKALTLRRPSAGLQEPPMHDGIPENKQNNYTVRSNSSLIDNNKQSSGSSTEKSNTRYLRVGALPKWDETYVDRERDVELEKQKEMVRKMEEEIQRQTEIHIAAKAVIEENDFENEAEMEKENAVALRKPKVPGTVDQQMTRPKATYFALTGQLNETVHQRAGLDEDEMFRSEARKPTEDGITQEREFEDFSVKTGRRSFHSRVPSIRRNTYLESKQSSQEGLEIGGSREETQWQRGQEKEKEFQKAMEQERQKEYQKMMEMERQRELEKERERQRELEKERERQRELEKERERQRELQKERERQRELEKERERQRELEKERERQKELEKERQRQKELEKERQRQKELEKERERQRELEKERERQRELEKERERQRELEKERERQRELEKERERQRELEKERERQRELEKERERQRELEKERERQRELEKERQRELEKERERQRELERQREVEKLKEIERQKQLERERQNKIESERRRAAERELEQQREAERQRLKEIEREKERLLEEERVKLREYEKQLEMERERRLREREVDRQKEMERQNQLDEMERWMQSDQQKAQEREKQKMIEDLKKIQELERRKLLEFKVQKDHKRENHTTKKKQEEEQKESEQEKRSAEPPLRPKVLDLDNVSRGDRLATSVSSDEIPTPRWRQPANHDEAYKPSILDVDSFKNQTQPVFPVDPFGMTAFSSVDLVRTKPMTTGDKSMSPINPQSLLQNLQRDGLPQSQLQAPYQSALTAQAGPPLSLQPQVLNQPGLQVFTSERPKHQSQTVTPDWTHREHQFDKFDMSQREVAVDEPSWLSSSESSKRTIGARPSALEQILQRHERFTVPVLSPSLTQTMTPVLSSGLIPPLVPVQVPTSSFASSPGQILSPDSLFAGPRNENQAALSPSVTAPNIWTPSWETAFQGPSQMQQRSTEDQEQLRMRSRSVSQRPAPAETSVDGPLARLRSRSAQRDQKRDSEQLKHSRQDGGKDTDTLVQETDSQYGTWDTGLNTDSSLTPVTPSSDNIFVPSPRKPSLPQTPDEQESLNFPQSSTTLLDSSAQRSKAQLSKSCRRRRAPPSRAARHSAVLPDSLELGTDQWRFKDTTEDKPDSAKQQDDESDEEEPSRGSRTLSSSSSSSQPQRVSLFPGMDPTALMAQLKKRGETDSQTDGPSPSQLSRSPKSPFLGQASRVLPPVGGKENGVESSPQWLKELKTKKRFSQIENDG